MAINPEALVPQGQIGSGAAQVFAPHDPTKFQRETIARGEEQKRAEQDKLADLDLDPSKLEDLGQGWKHHVYNNYSKKTNELQSDFLDITLRLAEKSHKRNTGQFIDINELSDIRFQEALLLDEQKKLNNSLLLSAEVGEQIDTEIGIAGANQKKYHPITYELQKQITKTNTGEEALEILQKNNGSTLIENFPYDDFFSKIKGSYQNFAEKIGGSGAVNLNADLGTLELVTSDGVRYNESDLRNLYTNSVITDPRYKYFAVDKFGKEIVSFVEEKRGEKIENKYDITNEEAVQFLHETETGRKEVESTFPPEWQKMKRQFRTAPTGGGRGLTREDIPKEGVVTTGGGETEGHFQFISGKLKSSLGDLAKINVYPYGITGAVQMPIGSIVNPNAVSLTGDADTYELATGQRASPPGTNHRVIGIGTNGVYSQAVSDIEIGVGGRKLIVPEGEYLSPEVMKMGKLKAGLDYTMIGRQSYMTVDAKVARYFETEGGKIDSQKYDRNTFLQTIDNSKDPNIKTKDKEVLAQRDIAEIRNAYSQTKVVYMYDGEPFNVTAWQVYEALLETERERRGGDKYDYRDIENANKLYQEQLKSGQIKSP